MNLNKIIMIFNNFESEMFENIKIKYIELDLQKDKDMKVKLLDKDNIIITFDYSAEAVSAVRSLPGRAYVPKLKACPTPFKVR